MQLASICSRTARTSASLNSLTRRVSSILTAAQISFAIAEPIPVMYVNAMGTRLCVGIFTPAIRAKFLLPFYCGSVTPEPFFTKPDPVRQGAASRTSTAQPFGRPRAWSVDQGWWLGEFQEAVKTKISQRIQNRSDFSLHSINISKSID